MYLMDTMNYIKRIFLNDKSFLSKFLRNYFYKKLLFFLEF